MIKRYTVHPVVPPARSFIYLFLTKDPLILSSLEIIPVVSSFDNNSIHKPPALPVRI